MILKGSVLRAAKKLHFSRKFSSDWRGVIGLEVHLQIASQSKLFSSAPATPGPANGQVALFDAAIPGTLPVLNRRCVEAAVQTALALNCEQINKITRFDRKHYFYADMPAGFQITQQFHPIARKGKLSYFMVRNDESEPEQKTCRIHQIQLEQDSGKSIHDANFSMSLIDLNRAGVGLLEIVFEPDLGSGEEATNLLKDLVAILKTLGVCTGRMDEGALRVDANVSIHKPGTPLGTRTEIKNMNSFRHLKHAIDFEIKRQISSVELGRPVTNVTMMYDAETAKTVVMRDKEIVQDYRFFPEPNLPTVNLDEVGVCVETLRQQLPPMPSDLREQLAERFKLPFRTALNLVREGDLYDMFIETMRLTDKQYAKRVSSLLLIEVLAYLYQQSISLPQTKLSPENLTQLVAILETRKANFKKCTEMLIETMRDGSEPQEILEANDWSLIQDDILIGGLCDEAINLYPKECGKFLKGKEKALNKLMAHVRKATDSRADMGHVKKLLMEKIRGSNVIKEEIQIGR